MKCIITAAGLGTRMLPFTKNVPKEMLPIFYNGELKPIIQAVFEQLYDVGIRDFIIVVGKGKRIIEDHFTIDYELLDYLHDHGKVEQARMLERFYKKVSNSNIVFVNQHSPKGFGDAVLRAKEYAGEEFLVVAPDVYIEGLEKYIQQMSVNSFLISTADDPRKYGVVIVKDGYVVEMEEKPEVPKSNMIILPYYLFDKRIFDFLEMAKPDKNGELQLTEGMRIALNHGVKFKAIYVEKYYDLGSYEGFRQLLASSTP